MISEGRDSYHSVLAPLHSSKFQTQRRKPSQYQEMQLQHARNIDFFPCRPFLLQLCQKQYKCMYGVFNNAKFKDYDHPVPIIIMM